MNDYNLENPYEIVNSGKWTIDKMIELAMNVYEDINGNGIKDPPDKFGYTTHPIYSDAFYYADGLKIVETDTDGTPHLSPDFGGEKTQSLIEKLCNFFYNTNQGNLIEGVEVHATFVEGRALFHTNEVLMSVDRLRDTEINYGILPMPKGSEEQENYITCVSFPYSLYSIPITAQNPNEIAATLECLGSESYRQVSPALFETALKVKYSNDEDDSQMYDIIRSGINFDLGRIFNQSIASEATYKLFRDCLAKNNINWASVYQKKVGSFGSTFMFYLNIPIAERDLI